MNVVIAGGGLTGLSAAFELQRLGVAYTLIEVKARLGGSICTRRESGFVLDGSAFLLERYDVWSWLDDLGMADALVSLGNYRDGDLVAFRDGTESLIDALRSRLTGTILTRMAVSSLGALTPAANAPIGVCLENGVLIEARGVIAAIPARFAAHMLYTLAPEPSLWLASYRYDPVVRVSLGFRRSDLASDPISALVASPPAGIKFLETHTLPERVPADHVLVRAGIRLTEQIAAPDDALRRARALIAAEPVVAWAHYWAEADPLTRHLPEHAEAMDALDAALPPNVIAVGSDYRALRLDQQVEQGRAAARRLISRLTRRRP